MTISAVQELGQEIDRAWRRVDFEREAFPALCADSLSDANLPNRIELDELIDVALRGPLPPQSDPAARFGQPPLTLFRTERFYVDVLFWVDGKTSIHDHAFGGAFQLLAGSSIETTFSFAPDGELDGEVKSGRLHGGGSALRRKGEVRLIQAGPRYIHSLFHVDRPSVSLVVRTFRDPLIATQYDYSPSGLAYNPFDRSEARDRAGRAARLLRAIEHPRLEQVVGEAIASLDFGAAFAVVRACVNHPDFVLDGLIDRIRRAELRDFVRSWVRHQKRMEFIASKRAFVRDPPLRFMLAILLNAQTRTDALRLAGSFQPERDPATQLASWLRLLSNTNSKLSVAGLPFEANMLALPKFDPAHEGCVAELLSGVERDWSATERVFLDQLRAVPHLSVLFR